MTIPPRYITFLTYTLLFSGLGLFSYMLLIPLLPDSSVAREIVESPAAYGFVIGTFVVMGFFLLKLSEWIDQRIYLFAERRWVKWTTYIALSVVLLGVNWGLLVLTKWLVGEKELFVFPGGGVRLLVIVWLVELVIVGLLLVNRSSERTLAVQREAARLREENDKARYEALQAQLNPHFLFNNLNTLVAEIEYDPKMAIRFTLKLSEVYRYVLQSQQLRLVPLTDELTFLDSYLYLHRVRLGDCITLYNRLSDETINNLYVPPLTLQLLVENVLKHNVVNEEYPMVITLALSPNERKLTVSNPLTPRRTTEPSGCGLRNLSNRYQLVCGKELQVVRDEEAHLFMVRLPLCSIPV